MPTQTDLRLLLRGPVDFELGDSPAESRFVFRAPDGEHRVTASEAIGALSQGIRTMNADPSARAWATPAILALRIMAKGHLGSLDASERSRLQDASRSVDRDPAVAQAKVRALHRGPRRRRTRPSPRSRSAPTTTLPRSWRWNPAGSGRSAAASSCGSGPNRLRIPAGVPGHGRPRMAQWPT